MDGPLAALAAAYGDLVPVHAATRSGVTYSTLRWAVARGHLRPAWHGVYVTRTAWMRGPPALRSPRLRHCE